MPRRTLQPIPRSSATNRDPSFSRQNAVFDQGIWENLDRVQVLGTDLEGHDGCVNALSWSDDGNTLLSGSDDRRICIWGPDTSPDSESRSSPHPLRLLETISTGHRANIFSAKYLPNASTPTIVTCAGDREVRVFDVERLTQSTRAESGSGRGYLHGESGPGVTVLKCHQDRTKRIATETSPFLFLTVSEDGTVRQHDLRRPHRCRSECPEPLFHAPRGVDLYSLSVSAVTPHIFAVAGRTDCAFVCDRRMPEHHTPSWGSNMKSSGQVHCVRRLSLPEYEWKSVEDTGDGRTVRLDRHITCVKLSAEKADEAICAFAGHSTALFSIHDDTSATSARSPSTSPPASSSGIKRSSSDYLRNPVSRAPQTLPVVPETAIGSAETADIPSSNLISSPGVRRRSSRSPSSEAGPSRIRPRTVGGIIPVLDNEEDDRRELQEEEDSHEETPQFLVPPQLINTIRQERIHQNRIPSLNRIFREEIYGSDEDSIGLDDIEAFEYDEEDEAGEEDEDGFDHLGLMEEDDDEDDDEEEDEDEDDYDDFETGNASSLSNLGEFGGVETIHPRMYYRGARNMETVKDCNFLGAMSDKVASGSDDGNFFVWNKVTGKLDGIWEGDGSIVNVMEQHPTLPLIAVSGIDETVKIFGPCSSPRDAQAPKNRTNIADSIIRANQRQSQRPRRSMGMGYAGIIQMLAERGASVRDGRLYQGDEVAPECTTQ